jgi:heparin binding hemagglutinin HbhA
MNRRNDMTDPNVSIRNSLYAAVGAGDAVVQAVADVVAQVRERADSNRSDVGERVDSAREKLRGLPADLTESVESLRDRLAGLPAELPEELAELREKFSPEELRRVAEAYLKVASDLYASLAERGEETVERLRKQPVVEEGLERAEAAFGDAVDLTEDALGTVARQTRAVGERAAKLAGLAADRISETAEGVGEAIADAGDEAAMKVLEFADQAEGAADEAADRVEVAALEMDEAAKSVTEKAAPAKAPAKAAPAKAPAKSAAAKAPAKKAAPRKTTGA